MKILLILLFLIFLLFLGVFLYSWYRLYQSSHLHVSANVAYVAKYPIDHEVRYFTTSDGIKIASWYIPVKNPKAVVILVHRYDTALGGKSLMLPHAQYLKEAGYSTLLVDLRSFGQSEGNIITFGINEWRDLSAAYDFVKSLPENKHVKVGFLGQSMGAVTAIDEVGLTGKGDFIIASVPFASFRSLFDSQIKQEGFPEFPFLPIIRFAARFVLGWNYTYYTPANQIYKIHIPIFFIEATQDKEINKDDVQYLYDHASKPKELWIVNAPHDVYESMPAVFQQKVLCFLKNSL